MEKLIVLNKTCGEADEMPRQFTKLPKFRVKLM